MDKAFCRREASMKPTPTLRVSILLLVCCASLGAQKPSKPARFGEELGQAPLAARLLKNPYEGDAQAVLAGKKVFKRHCAECHGLDGHGKDKAPDLHSPIVQSASPGTLFWFLKNGNLSEGMPSWSRLPDQQRWQLVTFLKSLGSDATLLHKEPNSLHNP